jgi:hypothetical protein
LAGAAQFVATVFGANFSNVNEVDLVKIVEVSTLGDSGVKIKQTKKREKDPY